MTIQEIREIAIDSSKAYYEYLDQNNKGIQEISVSELEYLQSKDAVIIKLRLSAKLFDTEAIFFKNLQNDRKYNTIDIKVIEYDNDKNILLIKPTESLKEDFLDLNNSDIRVISDLKFLVERVKNWYELNGNSLALPLKASKYAKDFDNIEFFKDANLQPSENQKKSLKNIFTNPFSYVWGAPGTGKTQFVLSYAVLHYIRKGDKIAILAPTNNAIEQVLKGIIKMTDKAGVDRKQIIRLGTPSKKFAEAFPEVCEERGIQKKIDEIDKQITILERVLIFQKQKKLINEFTNVILEIDRITELSSNIKNEQSLIYAMNRQLSEREAEIKLLSETLSKQYQQFNKNVAKTNSISHRMVKVFSSNRTKTENMLIALETEILNSKQELERLKYEISEITDKKNTKGSNVREIQKSMSNKIRNLISQAKNFSEIGVIISTLTTNNISRIKEEVNSIIVQKNEELSIDQYLFSEYKNDELIEIRNKLDKYLSLRNRLAVSSTAERLKSVNVVACTLDGYIGRYAEAKLDVEHIFLDEAGYASIIKTLTLFNHTTPISFLGDHQQLPPVCEIQDSDIKENDKFHNMFLWAQSAIFLDMLFSASKDVCRNQYLQNLGFASNSIITKTSLNSTYRFGNNLAQVLAKYVYEGNLNSSNGEGETKILYVNARKMESFKSRESLNEVSAISRIVANLKRERIDDFVILTPYKNQIKLLNKHLPQERNDLKILTVHSSQGREWHTVILSVVDTDDKWFVDTKKPISKGLNLVNTAVSRAKRNLIIVCDKNYWANQKEQLITELINCGQEMQG